MRFDTGEILVLPLIVVAACEWVGVVHFHSEPDRRGATVSPTELGIGLAAASDDEHHRPIALAEHSMKGLHIDATGVWGVARMRVNPDPAKLLRAATKIGLRLKVFSHCDIIEGHKRLGTALVNELNLVHEQQIIRTRNPERPDFGRSEITQKQQLRPCSRREPQLRASRLRSQHVQAFLLQGHPGAPH